MGISWGLLYNGSSTIALNVQHGYIPAVADDGVEFLSESVPVNVVGTSAADLDSDLNTLRMLCYAVAEYQRTKVLNKPIYFTCTKETVLWRSEIVRMRVVNANGDAYSSEHAGFTRQVMLEITRRGYFETNTEYPAQLRNANVADWDTYDYSAGEYGLKIYSGDDRSGAAGSIHTNYMFVKENATAPAIDLPTPVKLVFSESSSGAASAHKEIYIGAKYHCGSAGTDDLTDLLFEGSGAADATCSNDDYYALTFSDGDGTYAITGGGVGSLPDTVFQENKYYKAFLRFQATFAYTDLRARFVIVDDATGDEYETQWHTLAPGSYLYALDTVKIPFRSFFDNAYTNIRLYSVRLEFESSVASRTVNIDYLQFVPVDGYAEVKPFIAPPSGYGVSGDAGIAVDFSTNPATVVFFFVAESGYNPTDGYCIYSANGPGINLMPNWGAFTTAIFAHFIRRTSEINYPDDYLHINVFYRPRRRGL